MTPEPLPSSLTDQLGFLLGRAHLAHRQVAERAFASVRLSGKEVGALAILADEGPLSQQRLGERQGIDRTTMVAVVDGLERKRYVERRRDPGDRRAYALHPTPAGRRALRTAVAAAARAEDEFLASLSAADRQRLKRLLRSLIAPDEQP
jgi:DNA-binding MarR family transcriptional regulator